MTLEELEKRVTNLEDIENIKQLQHHYVNRLNLADYDNLVNCFSEDAIVDLHAGYVVGKNQIRDLFKTEIGLVHIGQEGPFSVHPIIKVNGDNAEGSWLLYIQYARPRKFTHKPKNLSSNEAPDWQQGYYDMKYKKQNGEWKISYLKWRLRLMSPPPQPAQ
jgi:hypothetical protein